MLRSSSSSDNRPHNLDVSLDGQRLRPQASAPSLTAYSHNRPNLRVSLSSSRPSAVAGNDHGVSPARRQRRRVDTEDMYTHSNSSAPNSAISQVRESSPGDYPGFGQKNQGPYSAISPLDSRRWSVSSNDSLSSGNKEDLTGAVGQLSLNEDEQVRYHGKASGLHILGNKERVDARNEGGIW